MKFYSISSEDVSVFENAIQADTNRKFPDNCIEKINTIDSLDDILDEKTYCSPYFYNSYIKRLRLYAFFRAPNLEIIDLPFCSIVGEKAFTFCRQLKTINLPDCVNIYSDAFGGCTSLSSLYLPKCKTISNSGFEDCTNLTDIYLPECSYIGIYCFASTGIFSLELKECGEIFSRAFAYCNNLSIVSLYGYYNNFYSMRKFSLSMYAFYSCQNLSTVHFYEGGNIGTTVFLNCQSLESIYIHSPNFVQLENSNAFYSTPLINSTYINKFASIYVPSSMLSSYKKAANWSYYADRFAGI